MTGANWRTPRTLEEALAILLAEPEAVPFAGGTDLMVLMRFGTLEAAPFVDIRGLSELRGISEEDGHLILGALTTYTDVVASPVVIERYPLLAQAAHVSGAWAVQNRGTLGGNIANASPAADTPPVLLVYDAQIELASSRGARWLPYREFHVGYKTTRREPGELITRLRLPNQEGARGFYRKVGTRSAQAISKVCLAGLARWQDGRLEDVRIALGSMAPTVLEARRTADYLRGRRNEAIDRARARTLLDAEIAPIDDIRSTERYRRAVAGNLLEQFLDETRPS
jgi:CO/xanthine dehydrogenase FAD-binding subunit